MKQLKFNHEYAKAIVAGQKTATFRVSDDKDLRVGDSIQLVDKLETDLPVRWTIPGELRIINIDQTRLADLSKDQLSEGEEFSNTQEMVQTFRRFYGDQVSEDTLVMVVHFEFEAYESPISFLGNVDGSEVRLNFAYLYADGGSRGNPGPSAAGFVILDSDNNLIHADNKYLGLTTNNQAEYHAVILGMKWAIKQGIRELEVRLDSMLVVNQLKGQFKVKNRDLWTLYETASKLKEKFSKFSVEHVPRELNKLADKEVNKALDAVKGNDVVQ